jgi:two-component system phosphate regulon response regulator PhoB
LRRRQDSKSNEAKRVATSADGTALPRRLVLVVEDHPDTRTAVQWCLSDRGYDVLVAADGEAAMRLVRERRPDVVYLDMNLPQISGYDVCEQIRSDPALKTIGILMTSAQGTLAVRAFCLDAGADEFLPKPFELEEVAEAIDKILAGGLDSTADARSR